MPLPIEDYALIGDGRTAALVGRDGSVDWFCCPRFDSPACFAALLGTPGQGRWQIAPRDAVRRTRRRYRSGTLILETEFETEQGSVRLIDFMPVAASRCEILRVIEGLSGRVSMTMELIIRFDYGSMVPWVRRSGGRLIATTGSNTLELCTSVDVRGEDMKSVADFELGAGERVTFALNHHPSYEDAPDVLDAHAALESTEAGWREWSDRSTYRGRWRESVMRSLLTLKALIYAPSGGIVAAPTTSLPEQWGGQRNWDYRYCWLRDATFTLNAMLLAGYTEEGVAWREWLERAAAGPADLRTLYSITGDRRLDERELDWLPGYEGAAPVRIGNAASTQLQLDVYGEIMDTLHLSRAAGLPPDAEVWKVQRNLLGNLAAGWQQPDEGIWEVRGPRRHFTHSKMMVWVAFDRAIQDAQTFGLEGPVAQWQHIRDQIHAEVCEQGYNAQDNTFVQSYGSTHLDASLLLMPQVGFLPPEDPRVRGTVEAIERHLMVDGLVLRYSPAARVDALPPGQGAFLPCSFWLVDGLVLIGRRQDGAALFERLLQLCNDVGLLAEEYDPGKRRMLGNFPQALTHMALINSACLLSISAKQARQAQDEGHRPASSPNTGGQAGSSPDLHSSCSDRLSARALSMPSRLACPSSDLPSPGVPTASRKGITS